MVKLGPSGSGDTPSVKPGHVPKLLVAQAPKRLQQVQDATTMVEEGTSEGGVGVMI
jgi:hypothetical protein